MTVDIFNGYVERWARDNIATGMPGLVIDTSEYGSTGCISVRPALSRLLTTGQVISNDEIAIVDVPVLWPSGGGAILSCPIKVGDVVWLAFCQRNLEDWVYSDGTQEVVPSDSRHFAMTDAIAIPCLYTTKNHLSPSTENVELKWGDKVISLKPSGEISVSNASGSYTLKSDGNIELHPAATVTVLGNVEVQGTIHATQNISSDTDVIADGVSGKNHTHAGSPTAPTGAISDTGAPN